MAVVAVVALGAAAAGALTGSTMPTAALPAPRFVDAGCTKFILFPVAPAGELIPQIELFGREILPAFA